MDPVPPDGDKEGILFEPNDDWSVGVVFGSWLNDGEFIIEGEIADVSSLIDETKVNEGDTPPGVEADEGDTSDIVIISSLGKSVVV